MTYLHYAPSGLVMNKMFGTNGIRGLINEELKVDLVLNLGRAIGSVLGLGQIALARVFQHKGESTNPL